MRAQIMLLDEPRLITPTARVVETSEEDGHRVPATDVFSALHEAMGLLRF